MAGSVAGCQADLTTAGPHSGEHLYFLRLSVQVSETIVCSATRGYVIAPIQSAPLMTPHEQRLIALAHVLMLSNPNDVVRALRRKNVMYFDRDGTLLFDPGPQWSDERLVEAAAQLFLDDNHADAPRQGDGATSRSLPGDLRP